MLLCFYRFPFLMSNSNQPYAKIREKLLAGELSVSSIVAGHLNQIHTHNKALNAFLEVYEEEAVAKAALVDAKLKAGTAGKLAGMVVGIKDLLCYEGHHSYAGSKILDSFKSTFSATAVQRLIDEDAIIIGRLNCDEFGMGSSNENSAHGKVLNAADETRVPGGSSGGSAVAVQANLCTVSLGTDTGGSVRQPAAFTGVIGMKPTFSFCFSRGPVPCAKASLAAVNGNRLPIAAMAVPLPTARRKLRRNWSFGNRACMTAFSTARSSICCTAICCSCSAWLLC